MSVTEVLMGAGSWGLNWRTDKQGRPTIPFSIRSQILPNDHIVIGPRGLVETLDNHADRLAAVKAARGYRGRIVAYDDTTLSGHGLASWLGYPTGEGPWSDARIRNASATSPSDWITDVLGSGVNGITKGTVSGGTSFAGRTSPLANYLSIVQWVAERTDTEWYINADGTLDMAGSTTLFPTPSATDATVITRKASGDEGGLSGVEAVELSRPRDSSNVFSRAVVLHSATAKQIKYATSTQTPEGVRWKDAAGNTPEDWSVALVAPREGADVADAFADRAVARGSVVPSEVRLTSRTHNVTAEVRPGDRVYVYDLDAGLTNSANQITWQGEVITPLQMRVNALTWPITADMGVYLVLDGDDWYDVSEYVQYEEPFVAWEVTVSGRKTNRAPISEDLVVFGPNARQARQALIGSRETDDDIGGWTPTWTNLAVGTGGSAANVGEYGVVGGVMRLRARATLGTGGGAGVSGVITLDIPTGWKVDLKAIGRSVLGPCLVQAAGTRYQGFVDNNGLASGSVRVVMPNVASTYPTLTDTSATVPATFTAGDWVDIDIDIPVEES